MDSFRYTYEVRPFNSEHGTIYGIWDKVHDEWQSIGWSEEDRAIEQLRIMVAYENFNTNRLDYC